MACASTNIWVFPQVRWPQSWRSVTLQLLKSFKGIVNVSRNNHFHLRRSIYHWGCVYFYPLIYIQLLKQRFSSHLCKRVNTCQHPTFQLFCSQVAWHRLDESLQNAWLAGSGPPDRWTRWGWLGMVEDSIRRNAAHLWVLRPFNMTRGLTLVVWRPWNLGSLFTVLATSLQHWMFQPARELVPNFLACTGEG